MLLARQPQSMTRITVDHKYAAIKARTKNAVQSIKVSLLLDGLQTHE